MDYIRKMVQSLIAGYVITLLMLGLLTYLMRKFILDEKAVDNIIFGICGGKLYRCNAKCMDDKKEESGCGNYIWSSVYYSVIGNSCNNEETGAGQ